MNFQLLTIILIGIYSLPFSFSPWQWETNLSSSMYFNLPTVRLAAQEAWVKRHELAICRSFTLRVDDYSLLFVSSSFFVLSQHDLDHHKWTRHETRCLEFFCKSSSCFLSTTFRWTKHNVSMYSKKKKKVWMIGWIIRVYYSWFILVTFIFLGRRVKLMVNNWNFR